MISLDIKYSPEIDEKRVCDTLARLEWFNKNGYSVALPTGITKDSDLENIRKAIETDYVENQKTYSAEKDSLATKWPAYEKTLENKLRDCDLKTSEKYDVLFTSYGVGGSYHLPNIIWANIKRSWQIGLRRTVIHEIIHLSIEPYIQKYKVSHWAKERIVDLLLNEFFPDLSKMQDLSISTEKIDKYFLSLYPDVVNIVKKITCS